MADVSSDSIRKAKNNHARVKGKHKGHKQSSHFKENDVENGTKYDSRISIKNESSYKDSKYKSHDRTDRNEERKKLFSKSPEERSFTFRSDEKHKHVSSHHYIKHEVNDDSYHNSSINNDRYAAGGFDRNDQIDSSFNEIRCDDRKTSDERFVSYNRNAVSHEDEFVGSLWQKIDYLSNQVEGLSQENEKLKCDLNDRRNNVYNHHNEVHITFLNKDLEEKYMPVLGELANGLIRGYLSVEELREFFLSKKKSAKCHESLEDDSKEPLFALDNSTAEPDDVPRVPMYEKNFSEILEDVNGKEELGENKKNKPGYTSTCFNCSEDHVISKCPYKIDYYRVAEAKRKRRAMHSSKVRYHIQDEKKSDFQPGVLSEELRKALDLKPNQIPLYIYRMRLLSYPPGWLQEAQEESSGINVYDSKGYALKDENDVLSMNDVKVRYDPDKLIDFPGFNVPLPPDFVDECYELGLPQMQEYHLRSVVEQNMPKVEAYQRHKRKRKFSSDHSSKIQRLDEDMDLDEDLEETNFEFIPPLPQDAPPPLPPDDHQPPPPADDDKFVGLDDSDSGSNTPIPDSLIEIVERFKVKQIDDGDDDDDDDRSTSYPSLKELEEIKKQLVLELGSVSGNSSPIIQDGNPPNDSDVEDSNPISGSRDASKDNNNDLSNISDCSFKSSPTKIKQSSSSLHRSDSRCSRSKRMTLGAPSLSRHSSFSKLPNYDKFSKNVASHMNFENLPNSTGTYEKMRKVIKKVKDKIHSIMP